MDVDKHDESHADGQGRGTEIPTSETPAQGTSDDRSPGQGVLSEHAEEEEIPDSGDSDPTSHVIANFGPIDADYTPDDSQDSSALLRAWLRSHA